jgi:hypothetical protein
MPKNDVRVKQVSVQLDKDRHLCYDMNAFCDLEEKFGTIDQAFEALKSGQIQTIRTMLWVGLLHEDETLTERQVGKWISLGNAKELSQAMTEAIQSALPQVDPNSQASPATNQ